MTILDYLTSTITTKASRIAITEAGKKYCWKEIDELSDNYANQLLLYGIRAGDYVGLLEQNSLDWIIIYLALTKIGAVSALLNYRHTPTELSSIILNSDLKYVCCGTTFSNTNKETIQILNELPYTSLIESSILAQQPSHNKRAYKKYNENEKHTSTIIYTSGSTVHPKGVLLTHESLLFNATSMVNKLNLTQGDVFCLSTPLFHIFSLVSILYASIITGAQIAITNNINSIGLIECLAMNSCTIFNGVPTSFLSLISNEKFCPEIVKSIRLCLIGGDKISYAQVQSIINKFVHASIMVNYGLTEGGFACNTSYGDDAQTLSSTVGTPLPGVEIAICDLDSKKHLNTEEKGEILIRSKGIMKGYFNYDIPAIDEDGFLHTGDIGILHEDGSLSVIDRKKSLIIRGGENISPREIETALTNIPGILDAAIVGVPNEILGEDIIAFIRTDNSSDIRSPAIKKLLARQLAKYKIPSKIITLDQFPLISSGKIDRKKLRFAAENLQPLPESLSLSAIEQSLLQ